MLPGLELKKIDKTCFICDGKEWMDADIFRAKAENMMVCKQCGFITFDRFHDVSEYETYYDKSYRDSIQVNIKNLLTTNRKVGYHDKFLNPWIKELLKNKKAEEISVGEIGSGIGYFLRWIRDKFKIKDITGSELTTTYRRYAKHAFDINVSKDFDFKKKYDLVCIYHTLEHIPDPKELLLKLKPTIKAGGSLYIATPIWMEEMMRWGGGTFDTFDEHFHPDHINAWSRWHLQRLLDVTGYKIISENKRMYGWTMLIEPSNDLKPDDKMPNSQHVMEQLWDMKRAALQYQKGNFSEAIRLYPRFVDAYLGEATKHFKDLDKQLQILEVGEKSCPNTILFDVQRGLFFYQYERFEECISELTGVLDLKPHDENVISHLAMAHLSLGQKIHKSKGLKEAEEFYKKAGDLLEMVKCINPMRFEECFNWQGFIMSKIPTQDELNDNGNKYTTPHSKDAPYIDLAKEEV